jgi:hypothetical protein
MKPVRTLQSAGAASRPLAPPIVLAFALFVASCLVLGLADAARAQSFTGDIVHTSADTRATIHMAASENKVNLYSATYFTVEEVSPKRLGFAMEVGKALFNLFRGADTQRQYNVRTPTATVGVKGTEFYVGTDGDTTFLLTVGGVVGMVNNAFQQREVVAEVRQASAARAREVPTPPILVPENAVQRVQEEDGLQAFRDLPLKSESEKRQGDAQDEVQSGLNALRNTTEDIREAASSSGAANGFRYRFDFQ